MSLKGKIEAMLFLTDKPLRAQAISKLVGEDVQLVRQSLLELVHDYEERDGGLEIADEDGYVLRAKDEYSNIMEEFEPLEMSAAVLRTLSAITIKQPISQSEIIRIRGAGAYDHIRDLVMRGLVSKREDEKSRSPLISTTKKFQEYFRLTKDGKSLRQYLRREMKKKDKEGQAEDTSFDASPEPVQLSVLTEAEAETFAVPPGSELAPLSEQLPPSTTVSMEPGEASEQEITKLLDALELATEGTTEVQAIEASTSPTSP
ncbi:MAG: SMC-Scp complex subunit ScpB [Candidatus Obscuribacterales bacterium]|nr:SMC-Scp complex subunit ScpB [Candidatus Obscuribacterales bacterium]